MPLSVAQNRRHRGRGFTLVELLVTLAIVSILATVAIPAAELGLKRSKEKELRAALMQIREALDAYKQAVDEGRIARSPLDSGYPASLAILVEGVEDRKSPTGARLRFLRKIPRDPFATDATMSPAATWGKRSYASPPENPKEGPDVYDVYSLNPRVGLNGISYREW